MTEKKNSEEPSTVTTYGSPDVTKFPKGQAPTQSLNDGAPKAQPGTEDIKI